LYRLRCANVARDTGASRIGKLMMAARAVSTMSAYHIQLKSPDWMIVIPPTTCQENHQFDVTTRSSRTRLPNSAPQAALPAELVVVNRSSDTLCGHAHIVILCFERTALRAGGQQGPAWIWMLKTSLLLFP
jgi:hypothetical protein